MKIGLLTSGGDCPGLNAAIRGVGKTAILKYGMEVVGFVNGYQGLMAGDWVPLNERSLSGILTLGGTILGTSREKPFKKDAAGAPRWEGIEKTVRDLKLDAVVCIGGNGTMKTAHKIAQLGINVVGIPKTIDNDVWATDMTFGFDSAVNIATDALDRLHTTANSHRRIMVVELMGHNAGWLSLHAGLAGGADAILLPEIPCSMDVLGRYLSSRAEQGKPYSIVVVAEGLQVAAGAEAPVAGQSVGHWVAQEVARLTGLESRETVLGYVQRGGSPSPGDRILATRLGTKAADLIAARAFGTMAALKGQDMVAVPLAEVAGKLKTVPLDHPLIEEARALGTCFGDAR